ncbi:unnamed protein product [Brachionus calyciflorus]|uniref:MULE transposase domain-containing protein n=1 Tax=Brachionus calyciflorus TaxID=104777 RepID=A0A813U8J6_9BILA|nr:unnamed protein product [Brachionus calyciflorus]
MNHSQDISEQLSQLTLNSNCGKVTISQKKKQQLYFKGYYYRISSTKAGIVHWRCIEIGCNIRCTTYGDKVGEEYTVTIDESLTHFHASDPTRLAILEKRRLQKEKAHVSDEPARKIMAQYVDQLKSYEEIVNSPSDDADRQAINREKSKSLPNYPPEPDSLKEVNIPSDLRLCLNPDKDLFLIYDSGEHDNDRFFIFGNEKNLKLMSNSHIFADGTFDMAPKLFSQVYSLHIFYRNKSYPIVYATLPRKTEKIYIEFLKVLKARIDIDPISISCDYEMAFINAVKKVFITSRVYCCYFHLNQNIWRRIQKLDLEIVYNIINGKYRKLMKYLKCICYIPTDDVIDVFTQIKSKLNLEDPVEFKINELYEDFEEFYLGKREIQKTGRGRGVKYTVVQIAKARYDIELWSINQRIIENIPRTTNYVESWHNAFGNMLKKHPNFYSLIDSLRRETQKAENNLLKAQTGTVSTRKNEDLVLDEKIRELLSEYNKSEYEIFFDKLALLLKY